MHAATLSCCSAFPAMLQHLLACRRTACRSRGTSSPTSRCGRHCHLHPFSNGMHATFSISCCKPDRRCAYSVSKQHSASQRPHACMHACMHAGERHRSGLRAVLRRARSLPGAARQLRARGSRLPHRPGQVLHRPLIDVWLHASSAHAQMVHHTCMPILPGGHGWPSQAGCHTLSITLCMKVSDACDACRGSAMQCMCHRRPTPSRSLLCKRFHELTWGDQLQDGAPC